MAAIGRQLNTKHGLGAEHALYRRDGKWFHHLKHFPGVLCDENGFVLFQTEDEYKQHPGLQHAQDLHAPNGIAAFLGYTKFPSKESSNKPSAAMQALKAKYAALEAENLRLHRRIVKLEAQLISARNATIARRENASPGPAR